MTNYYGEDLPLVEKGQRRARQSVRLHVFDENDEQNHESEDEHGNQE